MNQPTRASIINELECVLKNVKSRETVSEWAMEFINCENLKIVDFKDWDLLKKVGGIDLMSAPNEYLYGLDDIKKWITDCSKL